MRIWKKQRTLLIVGEGAVDEAFLLHAKKLYVPRGAGLRVTIKNARGKGASHAVEWTIRQMANASYDCVAVLLDTDVDWTPTVEKRARLKKIRVMKSTPCVDAVLLRLIGESPAGDSHALKKRLAPFLNHAPTDPAQFASHFGDAVLRSGRRREAVITTLLELLNVPPD